MCFVKKAELNFFKKKPVSNCATVEGVFPQQRHNYRGIDAAVEDEMELKNVDY